MGYSAQPGHVIFRTQAVPGTFQADLATAGVGMKLRSGALGTNREMLIPDPEIGGGRDVVDAYIGVISNSGDYEFYARLESIQTLLQSALGAPVLATAAGVTTSTFTPSDAGSLPILSIEEQIGNVFDTFQFTDAVVNTFHLEAEPNGFLMGTAGIIAKARVSGATPSTVTYDNSPLIVGTNITVTYNGQSVAAKSFSLDINNNYADDDHRLGSFYLSDLTPKRREITASFGIREQDKNFWRQAVLGASSAVLPTGVPTKQALVITANTYENIVGGAVTGQLQITIPKFAFKPYNLTVSGDDYLESTIEGEALRPNAGTPIATVVIKSAAATIA